jgi:hypothetical protein
MSDAGFTRYAFVAWPVKAEAEPQNIVLSGGSTMFEFFGRRLQRDLKQIVDTRINNSEVNSGSLMRVRPVRHLQSGC